MTDTELKITFHADNKTYVECLRDIYEQGRRDAIAEISREMRMLYGNEYEKQIRADAIDEYNSKIKEVCKIVGSCDLEDLDMLAKQLKEQNKK